MTLSLQLYDRPNGTLIADWSGKAVGTVFETGDHGFGSLSTQVPLPMLDIFEFYNLRGAPHLLVSDGSEVAYEGRVEDLAVQNNALRLTAFGYWRAMRDVRYTALWSSKKTDLWAVLTADDVAAALPDRFELGNQEMLYFAPRKNENFSSSTAFGMLGFTIPDESERQIVTMSFSYELVASSSWRATVTRRSSTWGSLSTEWTLDGNGSTQSGTGSLSFSACDNLAVTLFFNASAADYTGETGATYLKLTNVRVKTTTSAAVYADEIAAALVAFVNGVNSGMIGDDTMLIESPAVDLDDELYLDMWPADILDGLAAIGDDQSPPKRWEVGVWEGQRLHLREKGSQASTWYIDIGQLDLERSVGSLVNSAYATYNSGASRTAAADNEESQEVDGFIRRDVVNADTQNETLAQTYRDAFLDDGDNIVRAQISVPLIKDEKGGSHPIWMVRAGDKIVVRNLQPDLGDLDGVRRFTISQTRYDVDNDILNLTPEELPSLDLLVARNSKNE